MNKYICNALGSVSIGAVCILAWAGWQLGSAVSENRPEVKTGVHSVFAETRDITIAMIDKGRPGKPETMGLLPATRIVMEDVGATLKTAQNQVAQTSTLVASTSRNLDAVGSAVKKTADSLSNTADAAAGTAQGLTAMLKTTQDTVAEAKKPIGDLDTLLKQKALAQFVANLGPISSNIATLTKNGAELTGNANGIVADGRKVADKETADFLKPVKWYMQPIKKAGDIIDISAAVARHAP